MSQPIAHELSQAQAIEAARPVPIQNDSQAVSSQSLEAVLTTARTRIAPLWPLQHFVAVNPFLGLSSERFEEACATMRRVAGADMLMSRAYYRTLLTEGRMTDRDLSDALRTAESIPGAPTDLAELRHAIEVEPGSYGPNAYTVADVVSQVHACGASASVVEEISKWCGAYWDEGQAAWRMPWRSLPLYSAWRAASGLDRTPEVIGFGGFRDAVATLPDDPIETIETILETLGVSGPALGAYLHRALFSVRGWVAYARYLGWNEELDGEEDDAVIQLLAIRLAWDYALFRLHEDGPVCSAWTAAVRSMADSAGAEAPPDRDLLIDGILQTAFELSFQRGLIEKLAAAPAAPAVALMRAAVQAAFCIDVRSEVFRRALEEAAPAVQTIGFAGFFGFPIEYVPIGRQSGSAQCPVLLKPKFVVREEVTEADEEERTEILGLRLLRRRAAKAWKSFKSSAVSSFVYVETTGLAFAAKLVGDATGITRTVTHPSADGLDPKVLSRIGPEVEPGTLAGRPTGLTESQRVETAAGMLKAMSLTDGFARLVMLAGHGSTMVNNPHAAGYDCGACGGNPGAANARMAASILNDPDVRAGLAERGIVIPSETWFLGCLHDTTTDEVTVFDRHEIPSSHAPDLERLETWLTEASALARAERAVLLDVPMTAEIDAAVLKRSRDWSQVRPEWGLAGNAAFIAAPRERTRGIDLGGRVFLHDYRWQQDEGWNVLELILTAPMVVASWINLQYYGSSVNQEAFGSGNKVLHNVVGTLGVFEGNGGDLRVGLPWQTVHDGKRLVHEPLRLSVFIEAPTDQIDAVLKKHGTVRELVDNGWVHLFALAPGGRSCFRRTGEGLWVT
ncbi:MAG: DUF2309 domain-containing protein [Polyangiales bacterium]